MHPPPPSHPLYISPWISISTQLIHHHHIVQRSYARENHSNFTTIILHIQVHAKIELECHGEICNKTQCHSEFQLHTTPDVYCLDDHSGGAVVLKGIQITHGVELRPFPLYFLCFDRCRRLCLDRLLLLDRDRFRFFPFSLCRCLLGESLVLIVGDLDRVDSSPLNGSLVNGSGF